MINYTPETFNALTGPFLPFLGHPGRWAVGGIVAPLAADAFGGVHYLSPCGGMYIYLYIYIHPPRGLMIFSWVPGLVYSCAGLYVTGRSTSGTHQLGPGQQKRAPLWWGSRSHVLEALGLQFSASTLSTIAMRLYSSVPIDNKVFRGL